MTKRAHKGKDGMYHVKGKKYKQLVGARSQVWHGTAYKTYEDCLTSHNDEQTW